MGDNSRRNRSSRSLQQQWELRILQRIAVVRWYTLSSYFELMYFRWRRYMVCCRIALRCARRTIQIRPTANVFWPRSINTESKDAFHEPTELDVSRHPWPRNPHHLAHRRRIAIYPPNKFPPVLLLSFMMVSRPPRPLQRTLYGRHVRDLGSLGRWMHWMTRRDPRA
jgi:hypothetical protein